MQFEKKYWSKGEFTNSKGDEFNGYVGILDGEAYDYKTFEKLMGKDTYLARINCSKKSFDRTLSQNLKLPYNRQDVVFAANDFLYAGVVKTAIERLQENNDYLFRNSIISLLAKFEQIYDSYVVRPNASIYLLYNERFIKLF